MYLYKYYNSYASIYKECISSVQLLSHVQIFATPWSEACQAALSFTKSQSLHKLMSIESVMPSNHLILCHPFLFLPSIFPSIRVFSNESALLIKWPKYWHFSLSISPSNEYSELVSFRIDFFLSPHSPRNSQESSPKPQFKSITTSLVLSFLYSPTLTSIHATEKTIALTRRTFVGKVMSLFFNMLSRFVIAFLPRNKYLLISWLQSPSAVILDSRK